MSAKKNAAPTAPAGQPMTAAQQLNCRRLPVEFVEAMASQAWRTLRDWLEPNAPPEVFNLFMCHEEMTTYVRLTETNPTSRALENTGIVSTIADAADAISALGGVFHGDLGMEYERPAVDAAARRKESAA